MGTVMTEQEILIQIITAQRNAALDQVAMIAVRVALLEQQLKALTEVNAPEGHVE